MKRTLLLGLGIMLAVAAVADDVIVMGNGDVIMAKVMEITPTEIKYKKASNPDGPTYTVNKLDVFAINYENGEKETFERASAPAQPQAAAQNPGQPQYVAPVPAADNAQLIEYWNSGIPRHKKNVPDEKKFKDTNHCMLVYGITPNSILSDENVRISFEMNETCNNIHFYHSSFSINEIGYFTNYKIVIENKSDKTIYVDVANSFRISPKGEAESFYNNMTVTHNSNSGSGGSVGLGGVASALGVGGVIGNLASGISVGGGNSHGTSITENENSILTIPPGTKVEMPGKIEMNKNKTVTVKNYERFFEDKYIDELIKPDDKKPEKWRYEDRRQSFAGKTREYRITYSTQRDFATYTTLNIGVCVRGILGVDRMTTVLDIVVENGPEFFSEAR